MQTTEQGTFSLTLPNDTDIVIRREFNAPRELVFDVWTRPEHVRQWWGCSASELTVCEADIRPGGAWRYVMKGPDGALHPFKGVYQEVGRPARLVQTQIYDVEPYSAEEAVVTVDFEDLGGRTRVTETIRHTCKEARDGHVASGMEQGAAESLDQLEALLATLG